MLTYDIVWMIGGIVRVTLRQWHTVASSSNHSHSMQRKPPSTLFHVYFPSLPPSLPLTVIIQLANIGPLLVTLHNYFSPRNQGSGQCDIPISYLIIAVGVLSCLLMAMFWDR